MVQHTTRNLNVVKGNGVIGELLIFFVPFRGMSDQIARLRHRRGTGTRFRIQYYNFLQRNGSFEIL